MAMRCVQILLQSQFLYCVQENQFGDHVKSSYSEDEPQCEDHECQHKKENLILKENVKMLKRTNSLFQQQIENTDGTFYFVTMHPMILASKLKVYLYLFYSLDLKTTLKTLKRYVAKLKDTPVQKSILMEDGKSPLSPVPSGRSTPVTSGGSTLAAGRYSPLIPGTSGESGRSSPGTSNIQIISDTSTPVTSDTLPMDVVPLENDSSTSCVTPAAEQIDMTQNEVSGDMSNGDSTLDMVSIICSSFN